MLWLILMVALAAPPAEIPAAIAVYVKKTGPEGLTDPDKGRVTSINDLTARLAMAKGIRLVRTPEEAVVVVQVLARQAHDERSLMWGATRNNTLTVRVTAGEFSAELEGKSQGIIGGMAAAAGKVVKQLEAWVKTNHDKLLEMAPKQ